MIKVVIPWEDFICITFTIITLIVIWIVYAWKEMVRALRTQVGDGEEKKDEVKQDQDAH